MRSSCGKRELLRCGRFPLGTIINGYAPAGVMFAPVEMSVEAQAADQISNDLAGISALKPGSKKV
jgi:hypothetical protein